MKIREILIIFILLLFSTLYSRAQKVDPDTAYTNVLKIRVDKFLIDIIDKSDIEKYNRVREIIVWQYKDLSASHDKRDKKVKMLRDSSIDKETVDAKIDSIKTASQLEIFFLHTAYMAKLASEMDLQQVDMVKNGMTYSVMPNTYKVYLEMLPELTEMQKRYIKFNLIEARELAMDKGSSNEKHHTFGKYKGRINNYLSQQGYDLKQVEKDMFERKKKESSQ